MRPGVLWFSCPRDLPMLWVSIEAARRAWPDAWLTVIWPSDTDAPAWPAGVDCVRSDFDRGSNLSGAAAVAGVASVLGGAVMWGSPVIKLDSDTLVLRPDWAASVLDGAAYVSAWASDNRAGFGAAYALSPAMASAIAESMVAVPPLSPWEDIEIVGRARLLAGAHCLPKDIRKLTPDRATNGLRQAIPAAGYASHADAHAIHAGRIPGYSVAATADWMRGMLDYATSGLQAP